REPQGVRRVIDPGGAFGAVVIVLVDEAELRLNALVLQVLKGVRDLGDVRGAVRDDIRLLEPVRGERCGGGEDLVAADLLQDRLSLWRAERLRDGQDLV